MVLTAPRRQSLQHSQIEELKSTTNSNGAGLLHSLLETQANKYPERIAVQFEDVPGLSYNQLNGMANSVARKLLCGRGAIIPIAMERSISMVVAVLAVLKTGAAYVLLSPDAPIARNQFIVEDVKAPFVLVDETTTGQFNSSLEMPITRLVQRAIKAPPAHFSNLNLYQSPSDIAYVIYTSGTTGQPKGVLLSHLAATTGISAMSTPNGSEPPRQLLCHSPNFSAAQRTILGCLCRGGTLCLASKENITLGLFKTLREMNVNSLEITPSMLMLHDPATLPSNVKSITLGGEPVSSALIDAWADKVSLTSAYGLSECTQLNMRQRLSRGSPPTLLGKPTDSTTCMVLEPNSISPVPVNTPGELCLGGGQLAKGYLGLKEKTRAAFIKNPFGAGRLYRTGDMVVLRDDGSMKLVGRIDQQTKIDGQRVEPGEANAHIWRQLGVAQSHVVPATVLGRKALVAVVVSDQTVEWPALVREARGTLRTLLPSYAVPSYWVEVEQMPLNTSGKVDVAGLVAMVEGLSAEELITPTSSVSSTPPAGTPPDDAFELKVLDAVAATLSLSASAVSLDASFQELGGSSLNAIVLVGKLRAAGVQVSVPDILQAETLRDLRPEPSLVMGEVPAPFSLLPETASARHTRGLEDAYPATPLQEGLCLESIIGSADYVYRRTYRIQGVQPAQVRQALETVISKNPIFRTSFTQSKRSFIQSVRKSVNLPWKEYRGVTLDRAIEDLKEDPLELDGPLVRATVLDDSLLVLEMHHCLFDFWSSKFLAADAAAVLRGEQPVDRPPFSAYVAFNKAYASEPAPRAFWQEYLAGATETVVDLPPATSEDSEQPFVLRADIGDALQRLSSATGVTIGAAVHAAWAMTLASHLGTDEATFLSAFAGRDANVAGILSLNGPTLCTVPMRITVSNSGSVEEFAKDTQNNLWNVSRYAHSGLRDALSAASLRSSLFNTMVNVLAVPKTDAFAEDSALVPVDADTQNFTGYVCLELNEADPSRVKLLVPFAGVDRGAATALLDLFVDTVEQATANNAPSTAAEPQQLPTVTEEPSSFGLAHAEFEQRAAANASKTAVVESSGGRSWSYGEMDAKANNLARQLVQQDVAPGEIIPLFMDKSALTLVSILAILKAGAAFTPLDPRNPRERNSFIAQDVGAKRIITDVRNGEDCAAFGLDAIVPEQLDLDEGDSSPVDVPSLSPASTAYLIYTSGSTGLPKGVVVPHSAVAASAEGMIEATAVTADWVSLWTLNYVFDASYYDVFTVLSAGATLCVAPQDDVMSDLAGHINRMGVEQVMLTPTMAKLISGGPSEVPKLKVLNVCGEKIDSNIQEWAKQIDVYNGYGPTEATILMTVSKVAPDGDLNSIGLPLRHATAVILPAEGSSLKRLPAGEVGELCVRGAHLATGYLNRPEQTAKAFVRDADGEVLYRTGDLARWADDGSLICLGRKDYQVKLNGFRIELGEIENAVLRTDCVDASIVSVAELAGKKQLVAFVVLKGDHEPNTQKLLSPEDKLPAIADVIDGMHTITHYMMPSVFLPFSGFPTLPSGKANRKELVALAETLSKADVASYVPKNDDEDAGEVEPVSTEAERVMQAIWAAVLDQPLEAIGANSSFLALGGDSIAGINVAGQCRKKSYKIALSQVLALPTLREQAAKMEKIELAPKKAAPAAKFTVPESVRRVIRQAKCEDDVEDIYPCGAGQIEFLTQGRKDRQYWNLTVHRDLPASFDLDAWKAATTQLTARNQILRAFYVLADEADPASWYQVVLKFPTLDWDEQLYSTPEEKTQLAEQLRDSRFAPGTPHVRYRVLRSAADGTRTLAIKLDHGTYDGTLLRIFQDQFAAIARGDQSVPPVVDFKQFITWDAANDRAADLSYWHTRLRHPAPPPRPLLPLPTAPATDRLRFVPLQADVDAIAAKYGVTAMTVFSAVYALVAGRVLGTDDAVIDNLVAGRNADIDTGDAQLLNGTCANFLPMRMGLSADDSTVSDWMAAAQNDFWESAEHGRVGLGDIYGAERDAAGAAKLLFVFQPFAPAPVGAKPDPISWLVMKAQQKIYMVMNYALAIEVQKTLSEEGKQGYRLKVQWDSRGLSEEKIDLAMGLFEGVLGRLGDGEKKELSMDRMVEFVGGF
ncbi:Nonribosomal peptide synthetase 7 [Lasiodiplodia theobromae]|uniref:Nonribosomal peptide synthetase 7 n=1 Tax=Lasiodiplodia theobromae TaxID=45133 RepID=A0A5N5D782_9PEZI|nr:Nonribosomal peptide synthetase 7 [Lasiodiplodia theobromae]